MYQKEDQTKMRKSKFLAVLAGFMSSLPFVADAAYPVYNPQQLQRQGYVINNYPTNSQQMVGTTNITTQQLAAAANVRTTNNIGATNPNRVTGALPRVGSSATNAGRQYYQSADYDRLSESGLYIGLSAAYSTMLKGSMSADFLHRDLLLRLILTKTLLFHCKFLLVLQSTVISV